MRCARVVFAFVVVGLVTGCGYVHFGRRPNAPAGDAALSAAYSDLATQHKMLKQELALARKEGDTLRIALERAGGTATPGGAAELQAQLNAATQELATLRASHTKLQADAARGGTEKKSAVTADETALREENARLRAELDKARAENLTLGERLRGAEARYERAQNNATQLGADLLAQKDARVRAEQATGALRSQLDAVLARGAGPAPAPGNSGGVAPNAMAALQGAKAPPADSPTADLRTAAGGARPAAAHAAPTPRRTHVVQSGDTLESIARHYYGAPEQWRRIYDANTAVLGTDGRLRAGMTLQVPEQ